MSSIGLPPGYGRTTQAAVRSHEAEGTGAGGTCNIVAPVDDPRSVHARRFMVLAPMPSELRPIVRAFGLRRSGELGATTVTG